MIPSPAKREKVRRESALTKQSPQTPSGELALATLAGEVRSGRAAARGNGRRIARPLPVGAKHQFLPRLQRLGHAAARLAGARPSEHIARQIVVVGQTRQAPLDVGRVDQHPLRALAGGLVGNVLEHFFHHRVQPARPDVLGAFVDGESDLRQAGHPVLSVASKASY